MAVWIWIFLILLGFLAGVVIGFLGARTYMKKYLKENPPINQEQIRAMMLQMGQKPSQKKLNQMMKAMKSHASK